MQQGVFLFYVIQYIPVSYGENYQYPWWAEVIGIIISLSSMLWIPGYAVYYIITTPGTLREVCVNFYDNRTNTKINYIFFFVRF